MEIGENRKGSFLSNVITFLLSLVMIVMFFLSFGCATQIFKPYGYTDFGYTLVWLSTIFFFLSGVHIMFYDRSIPDHKKEYIFIHPWLRNSILGLGFPPFIIRLIVLILGIVSFFTLITAINATYVWFSDTTYDNISNETIAFYFWASILGFPCLVFAVIVWITKIIKWIING